MDRRAFGKRLRQLRREKSAEMHRDISAVEVAEAIGVTAPCYINWETGRGRMSIYEAWKLADFYTMPIGELVGRILCEESTK